MPSESPRVNLTLPHEVVAVLDRISKATKLGRATIIREWLIEGLAGFEQMAAAIELAQQKNIDAFKVVAKALREVSAEADQMELEVKRVHRAARRKRVS